MFCLFIPCGDEIMSDESPSRSNQVIVRQSMDHHLQLSQLLLSRLLLITLLFNRGYLQRQLVYFLLRPPQQAVVLVTLIRVLQQPLDQESVPRNLLEWFCQQVCQAQLADLPLLSHVLEESVKSGFCGPSNLDGIICSLDITDKCSVRIYYCLLSKLKRSSF